MQATERSQHGLKASPAPKKGGADNNLSATDGTENTVAAESHKFKGLQTSSNMKWVPGHYTGKTGPTGKTVLHLEPAQGEIQLPS